MKNKKGLDLLETWVEWSTLLVLILGLIISVIAGSTVVSYIIIFLCALLIGRWFHTKRLRVRVPFYIITIGFLIGYLIGSRFANRWGLLIIFIIGCYVGDYLIKEGHIK